MELAGTQEIRRDPAGVWTSLNDPAVLKQCIPGCESLEADGENAYRVVVMAAVGPVKARFNGKLALSDIRPPESYAINFEGTGGAAGFAKGGATVSLAPAGSGTLLSYQAHAKVGGKLAQVGSRLIDGVAAKMSAEFFDRFKAVVEQPAPADADENAALISTGVAGTASGAPAGGAASSAASAGSRPAAGTAPRPTGSRYAVIAAVVAVVVVAVLWYLSRGQ